MTDEILEEMFADATKGRAIIHEKNKHEGLKFEEIQFAVRGRFSWDTQAKKWDVGYKAYRDYWILFLLTCNERLFALQVPKVVP